MLRFHALFEVFNTKVQVPWAVSDEGWRAPFEVGGVRYLLRIIKRMSGGWEVVFDQRDAVDKWAANGAGKTATYQTRDNREVAGNQSAQVFGVVVNAVQDMIHKFRPALIAFTAYEPSRVRLYKAMALRLTKGTQYEVETVHRANLTMFHLKKTKSAAVPGNLKYDWKGRVAA